MVKNTIYGLCLAAVLMGFSQTLWAGRNFQANTKSSKRNKKKKPIHKNRVIMINDEERKGLEQKIERSEIAIGEDCQEAPLPLYQTGDDPSSFMGAEEQEENGQEPLSKTPVREPLFVLVPPAESRVSTLGLVFEEPDQLTQKKEATLQLLDPNISSREYDEQSTVRRRRANEEDRMTGESPLSPCDEKE